jgi:hypothetical protein
MNTTYFNIQGAQCQYFKILHPSPFPVRNVIWTWEQFSLVAEVRSEIKYDLNDEKYNHSQRDGAPHISVDEVPEWAVSSLMHWSWWSAQLVTAIGPHTPYIFMYTITWKNGVRTQIKQELGTISLNFRYCQTQEWPRSCTNGSDDLEFQIFVAP